MVSVIPSTWMLVGGPGGPDRWHSQGRKENRKIERQMEEEGRGGRECKSGKDGKMVESVAVVLAPEATAAMSVQCETFGSYWV